MTNTNTFTPSNAFDSLKRFHNNEGGVIMLTNDSEKLRPMMLIDPTSFEDYLPGILEGIFPEDSYCTVSRFDTPPSGKSIPAGWVARKNVSNLTAAFVDLDGYHAPGGHLELWELQGEVARLVERGIIPEPSVRSQSGRGLWLFWRLSPVELATPRSLDTLERINRKVVELLRRLGADPKAASAKSWTRLPHSINSKSGARVLWLFAANEGGPITYTLAELATFFAIDEAPYPAAFDIPQGKRYHVATDKNPQKQAAGLKGHAARCRNILAALQHLASLRGGFRSGTREMACCYLAVYLIRLGVLPADVLSMLTRRGLFSPSLPPATIRKHVAAAVRTRGGNATTGGKPPGHQTMANVLGISPNESATIFENLGIRFPFAYENQLPKPTPPATRKELAERLRAKIHQIVTTSAAGMTERALAAACCDDEGQQPSTETVHKHLVALGLNRPRQAKPKPPTPPSLPFAVSTP